MTGWHPVGPPQAEEWFVYCATCHAAKERHIRRGDHRRVSTIEHGCLCETPLNEAVADGTPWQMSWARTDDAASDVTMPVRRCPSCKGIERGDLAAATRQGMGTMLYPAHLRECLWPPLPTAHADPEPPDKYSEAWYSWHERHRPTIPHG